jgi:hypothetical protein
MKSRMTMKESLAKQGFRLFGPPPAKGASRGEALRYIRRINVRLLVFSVPVWVLLVLSGQTWAWIVAGVTAAMWLQSFISLSIRLQREQKPSTHE